MQRTYPIVLWKDEGNPTFGVGVPDLPGCFSAGDTLEEALKMVREAIQGWCEVTLESGKEIPDPTTVEKWRTQEDYRDVVAWAFVEVEVPEPAIAGAK